MFTRCHFQMDLVKKNHLVHLVIANALKPTHTLTILEPISDFDVPENVCWSFFQVLVLLVLLLCFHTHSTFVLDFVNLCNYLVTTILDFAPIVITLYGRARGDFSIERLLFVCRCEEQFCFTIFFLGTSPPSTV